jgi:hypothetical protein
LATTSTPALAALKLACARQAGAGRVQRRLRNESLFDQRGIVVVGAPRDVDLRLGGLGLLLGLAQPGLGIGGVHTRDDLPGLDGVAFTQGQVLQFARYARLDEGGVGGLERAGYRQHLAQHAGADLHQVSGDQFDHRFGLGCRLARGLLACLALVDHLQGAKGECSQRHCDEQPLEDTFHGEGVGGRWEVWVSGMRRPLSRMSTCAAR